MNEWKKEREKTQTSWAHWQKQQHDRAREKEIVKKNSNTKIYSPNENSVHLLVGPVVCFQTASIKQVRNKIGRAFGLFCSYSGCLLFSHLRFFNRFSLHFNVLRYFSPVFKSFKPITFFQFNKLDALWERTISFRWAYVLWWKQFCGNWDIVYLH